MDAYRASEIHHSPINRSFVSQSRVRSTIESTIDYQHSQYTLSKIMKYLFGIIAIAMTLLLFFTFYDKPTTKVVESIDKTGWSMYDNFKYSMFDIKPALRARKLEEQEVRASAPSRNESGFLDNLKDLWPGDKSCGSIREFEQKLRTQRFSVQRHVDHLPSLDDIRANRDKYELSNELNRSCLEGELDLQSPLFTNIISNFDSIVGVGHLTPKSTQEEFSVINTQLHNDESRYKDAERLLDNDFVYGVKSHVNDLVHSHKNLQEKRVLLNGYRFNLFNHLRQLELIINEIKNAKADVDTEKGREVDLHNKLAEAAALVSKYEKEMKEKEDSMSNRQQKELAEIRDVNDRIDEIRASIANADKIRADLRLRRDRISKTQGSIAANEAQIADTERESEKLQAERRDKANAIKSLQDANEMYDNRRKIHAIKLDVLLRNKEIKKFLDKLINSNTNIENLTSLMESKISDEEKLVLLMKDYNEESAAMDRMDGKTVIETETVNSDTLKYKIEKDRQDFKQIMEKYLGLRKVVEEYENPDIEINDLKVKIEDLHRQVDNNTREKSRIQNDIDKLDKHIIIIDERLRSLKDKNTTHRTAIEQDEQYIKDKESMLSDAERKLNDLLAQKAVLDEKYKVD